MNEQSELERVLAELETPSVGHARAALMLRELRADFERFAWHGYSCPSKGNRVDKRCSCGLDAARAKWGLP